MTTASQHSKIKLQLPHMRNNPGQKGLATSNQHAAIHTTGPAFNPITHTVASCPACRHPDKHTFTHRLRLHTNGQRQQPQHLPKPLPKTIKTNNCKGTAGIRPEPLGVTDGSRPHHQPSRTSTPHPTRCCWANSTEACCCFKQPPESRHARPVYLQQPWHNPTLACQQTVQQGLPCTNRCRAKTRQCMHRVPAAS